MYCFWYHELVTVVGLTYLLPVDLLRLYNPSICGPSWEVDEFGSAKDWLLTLIWTQLSNFLCFSLINTSLSISMAYTSSFPLYRLLQRLSGCGDHPSPRGRLHRASRRRHQGRLAQRHPVRRSVGGNQGNDVICLEFNYREAALQQCS